MIRIRANGRLQGMTGGSLPAQAGPVGIAGVVQPVQQGLPAVAGAAEGSVNRGAA